MAFTWSIQRGLAELLEHPHLFAQAAGFLTQASLQVFAAASSKALKDAYGASGRDAWAAVDMSTWKPLEDQAEPGDADLRAALLRIPPGRLRHLVLRSSRCSDAGVREALQPHIGLEELCLDCSFSTSTAKGGSNINSNRLSNGTSNSSNNSRSNSCSNSSSSSKHSGVNSGDASATSRMALSGAALSSMCQLRRLDIAGVKGAVAAVAERPRTISGGVALLEELFLRTPDASDLDAASKLCGLRTLQVSAAPLRFDPASGLLVAAEPLPEELIRRVMECCPQLEQIHVEGCALLSEATLKCAEALANLQDLRATCPRQVVADSTAGRGTLQRLGSRATLRFL
ncbi:unnamed protein product [Polarella glacialis]|uniref:Uncharacterized protein n=1 Tax=Polarella glacialis TaxID=89957 RepID=A0A813HQ06_POLGL|nr:unnamed protein product [Polarella glacialis]